MIFFLNRIKLFAVLMLIIALILSAASCSDSESSENTESDTNISESTTEATSALYDFEKYSSDTVYDIEKIDLSERHANKCETYKFTYRSGDYEIKAYISIPASVLNTDKPSKCVMFCRGGNNNFGKLTDDYTAEICSKIDRVVVASQYRSADGSTGKDEFGGGDLNDVINLIDICEKEFSFIDMNDFGVMGVSRGGVMIYQAARDDKRVKWVIAVSAESDVKSAYYERDDMSSVLYKCIGGTPEDLPEEYEKRSAIYWYDKIKVPVLMIHSKKDERVPFSHAEALYEKLKNVTECKFVTYEDDTHGFHPEDTEVINEWLENKKA